MSKTTEKELRFWKNVRILDTQRTCEHVEYHCVVGCLEYPKDG